MTTDISVSSTAFQVENRSWLIPQPGGIGHGYTAGATLDFALFTAGTHYPNGYIPSGTTLGVVTATGFVGPYDAAATDGRQTASGILWSSVKQPTASTTRVGCAVLKAFAVVKLSKLPFALAAAGRASLPLIHFEA